MDWGIARLAGGGGIACDPRAADAAKSPGSPPVPSEETVVVRTGLRPGLDTPLDELRRAPIPGDLLGTPSPVHVAGAGLEAKPTRTSGPTSSAWERSSSKSSPAARCVRPLSVEREVAAVGLPRRISSRRLGGGWIPPGPTPPIVDLVKRCLQRSPCGLRPRNAFRGGRRGYRPTCPRPAAARGELARFFPVSPDLFCLAGLDGYFKQINHNFTRVLGYSDRRTPEGRSSSMSTPTTESRPQLQVVRLSRGSRSSGS